MDDAGFREYLKSNGAASEAGRNSRVHAVRKIESALAELGFPHPDLEAAHLADAFATLRVKVKDIRRDALVGGQAYRVLMPESENPKNRLASWNSWLAQYGRFLKWRAGDEEDDRFLEGMDQLKATFEQRMPDFQSFKDEEGAFWDIEAQYKQATHGEIIFASNFPDKSDEHRGLKRPGFSGGSNL